MSSSKSLAGRHLPGEEGIWLFVLGDLVIFSLFFGTFLFYRGPEAELYAQSQTQLNQSFGAINTLLLLTSSWFLAMATKLARLGDAPATARLIGLTFLCGLGFAAIKITEFSEKLRAGISVHTNDFFMYYFMLTGIHFVHVIIGLGVLTFIFLRARNGLKGAHDVRNIESGATFWHMVDLLWVILFPLIYLLR